MKSVLRFLGEAPFSRLIATRDMTANARWQGIPSFPEFTARGARHTRHLVAIARGMGSSGREAAIHRNWLARICR